MPSRGGGHWYLAQERGARDPWEQGAASCLLNYCPLGSQLPPFSRFSVLTWLQPACLLVCYPGPLLLTLSVGWSPCHPSPITAGVKPQPVGQLLLRRWGPWRPCCRGSCWVFPVSSLGQGHQWECSPAVVAKAPFPVHPSLSVASERGPGTRARVWGLGASALAVLSALGSPGLPGGPPGRKHLLREHQWRNDLSPSSGPSAELDPSSLTGTWGSAHGPPQGMGAIGTSPGECYEG